MVLNNRKLTIIRLTAIGTIGLTVASIGLSVPANELTFNLSGGQQRLCIARALATTPEIILFDEPTSALDPIATANIEELMEQLKQQVTILIVTHSIQQAAPIYYTAFMYVGSMVEFNKTKTIFTEAKKKQIQDYVKGRFG